MKRNKKTHSKATSKRGLSQQVVHPNAAGIDCGAEELVCALPPGRSEGRVRSFSSFTGELQALCRWVVDHGIDTVAIESTGNYWITIYQLLEEAGIEVYLVNARHVKGVPGRKTDVCDAVWLQQLHAAGLLSKSFRPATQIAGLRYLMRHRGTIVQGAAVELQHMQKALTEMNIKLQHVFSDIDGASAQGIITAILDGERDPGKLAGLRDTRCKSPLANVKAALQGDYRREYLFVLKQARERWQRAKEDLAKLDQELLQLFQAVPLEARGTLPQAAKRSQRLLHKNTPAINVYEEGWRFYGVDLSAVDGVSAGLISVLMSELGTAEQVRKAFPSEARFCSWLGLCPDNRISGGKVLSAKTRRVVNPLATAFRLSAQAVAHSKSKLGEYARRMKARLGKAEGIAAAAHRLARIVIHLILTGEAFDESKAFPVTQQTTARKFRKLKALAAELGLQIPNLPHQPV